ncbi:hypothetical protein PG994_001417 [Apiospora phragmitis]|uniref:Uncharacterized protein n=1 Tax=Apiospora phragmitis TaxID=2905665 RepID=A0ABR1WTK1_9PEZI
MLDEPQFVVDSRTRTSSNSSMTPLATTSNPGCVAFSPTATPSSTDVNAGGSGGWDKNTMTYAIITVGTIFGFFLVLGLGVEPAGAEPNETPERCISRSYYERSGDAPVHTLSVNMLLPKRHCASRVKKLAYGPVEKLAHGPEQDPKKIRAAELNANLRRRRKELDGYWKHSEKEREAPSLYCHTITGFFFVLGLVRFGGEDSNTTTIVAITVGTIFGFFLVVGLVRFAASFRNHFPQFPWGGGNGNGNGHDSMTELVDLPQ